MKKNMLKITLALFMVLIASCAQEPNTKQTLKISTYVPADRERTISYSQAIQPDNVTCPKCNQKGVYIHSFINSDASNLFFSKYKCPDKHQWLIVQNYLNGPITKTIILESK